MMSTAETLFTTWAAQARLHLDKRRALLTAVPHVMQTFWMSPRLSVTVAALLLLFAAAWLRRRWQRRLRVPIVLADEIRSSRGRALAYCYRSREIMHKGYAQFPGRVFGIDTRDGVKLVIPASFLDDLKSHPHLSFKASIDNDMQVDYTHFGGPPEYVIHAVKGRMTSLLPAFTPILHEMAHKNVLASFGKMDDWTPVRVHDTILHIVGINNARVFQGTAASEDSAWVSASTGYVLSVFSCIRALKAWPPWLRPLVYRFAAERQEIQQQWAVGRRRVATTMAARRAAGGDLDNPPSMLDLLSSGANAQRADDVEEQTLCQMTLVAVGTVTTFASLVQAIYDLAQRPEYVADLRAEVEEAVGDRHDHRLLDRSTIRLPRMDSFIKESQRLAAADLTTFQRAATADLHLPDGTFVARGTKLETNTVALHTDDALYPPSARTFDGMRFFRQRQAVPAEANRHLYYSVGRHDLAFGYGRHACPGRYLGHHNIKIVLAEILLHYDLCVRPGQPLPVNDDFEALSSPDPTYEILMRSLQ